MGRPELVGDRLFPLDLDVRDERGEDLRGEEVLEPSFGFSEAARPSGTNKQRRV